MVRDCVRDDVPFGVLLIKEGLEAGGVASTHDIGTLARITDWYQGSDGLLGVTAIGLQRFRVISSRRESNGLNVGTIELLPDEPCVPLPAEHQDMSSILSDVLDDLGRLYESLDRYMEDAGWVTSRFVEILPIDLEHKQRCLENCDPQERLRLVRELLDAAKTPPGGT